MSWRRMATRPPGSPRRPFSTRGSTGTRSFASPSSVPRRIERHNSTGCSSGQLGGSTMSLDITKGATRVHIDPKRCIANAKCTTAAPGIFVLDEETGIAVIENADEATVEQLFAGARACPTQAIIVEQFGRRVYPTILPPMFGASKEEEGRGGE